MMRVLRDQSPAATEEHCRDTADGWIEAPSLVNKATAMMWVARNNVAGDEFLSAHGERDRYDSGDVRVWLGY